MALHYQNWGICDDPANPALDWSSDSAMRDRLMGRYAEALRQALVEKHLALQREQYHQSIPYSDDFPFPALMLTPLREEGIPGTTWARTLDGMIDVMIPYFVNHLDRSGNWDTYAMAHTWNDEAAFDHLWWGTVVLPRWTLATAYAQCTDVTTIRPVANGQCSARWARQKYQLLNLLRWTQRGGVNPVQNPGDEWYVANYATGPTFRRDPQAKIDEFFPGFPYDWPTSSGSGSSSSSRSSSSISSASCSTSRSSGSRSTTSGTGRSSSTEWTSFSSASTSSESTSARSSSCSTEHIHGFPWVTKWGQGKQEYVSAAAAIADTAGGGGAGAWLEDAGIRMEGSYAAGSMTRTFPGHSRHIRLHSSGPCSRFNEYARCKASIGSNSYMKRKMDLYVLPGNPIGRPMVAHWHSAFYPVPPYTGAYNGKWFLFDADITQNANAEAYVSDWLLPDTSTIPDPYTYLAAIGLPVDPAGVPSGGIGCEIHGAVWVQKYDVPGGFIFQ